MKAMQVATAPQAHQNARQPQSCAHPVQHEVAGHLENHVADEKDAGAKSEHRRPKAQIVIHPESGKADIDPIEVVKEHHRKN